MAAWSIGKKVFSGTGALLVLAALLGITGYVGVGSVGDRLNVALGPGLKKELLANRIATEGGELLSIARGELVRGATQDTPAVETYHRQFATLAEGLQSDMATLDGMVARPDAKQALVESRALVQTIGESEQAIHNAIAAGDMKAANVQNNEKLYPAATAFQTTVAKLVKVQDEVMTENGRQATGSVASSRMVCLIALLMTMGLGALIIWVMRGTIESLRNEVDELSGAINEIAGAASQVASSSQTMAEGASEQAATIEETSSASAEINSMAQRNTENSRSTAEIVSGAQVRTTQTNASLTEMVAAMDGITASSQKISKIIKVIDEIAFQTNILALNAAVEAARAGDAGMGFAVVADEVRNLAQRSAQAAKDTADLIEESIQRSHGGKTKVDQVASGIHTVNEETAKIKVLVDEINLGSVEQSRGIDQISRSITEMEQVTQSNAASAEESAAAAQELSSQAESMREVVDRLSAMVGASPGGATGVPRAAVAVTRQKQVGQSTDMAFKPVRSAATASAGASRY